jgi:glucose/mannose transport system substrate-binding protein
MRSVAKPLLLCVSSFALLAGAALAQTAPKVEVLHWLTAGAESAAIGVLADGVTERGGEWVEVATPGGGSAARALLATGVASGNPPGISFLGMGTETAELAAQGVMRDVGGYAREKGYLDSVPAHALAMGTDGSDDGAIYALPVAFETQNFMWCSKPVFEKTGLTPPKTWNEFLEQAPKLEG